MLFFPSTLRKGSIIMNILGCNGMMDECWSIDDYCCANHSNMCVHDSDIARITWFLNSCGILVGPNCLCFFPQVTYRLIPD